MLSTTLINPAMPLIRYELQDLVDLPNTSRDCPCGRGLPVLGQVMGRFEDTILTADGRRVGHLVGFLSAGSPVKEIQVVQESLKQIAVKVVPAHDWSHWDEKAMRDKLKSRIGEADIKVELVEKIERSKSGKFRAVISKVESILPESKK
jgi:phenylacetate-CoA ligase